jgi:hypothetical protein
MPAYECPDSCTGNPCWVQDTITIAMKDVDLGNGYGYAERRDDAEVWVQIDPAAEKPAPGEHGHYSRFTPQPIDIIAAWNLNHWQAEALTYLVRYDMKGGREDLEKAIWYINDLIKRKYGDS